MKALYISTQIPTYNGPAGSKTAMDNLINLATEYTVDLVLISSNSYPFNIDDYADIDIDKFMNFKLPLLYRLINIFGNLTIIPPKFSVKLSSRVASYIEKLTLSNNYSIIFLEFSESVVYLNSIRCKSVIKISLHDILTQWHLRRGWYLGVFSSFVYKYEKIQYSKADAIIVQSEKDRYLVKSLFSCGNVELISPSISKFIYGLTRTNDKIENHSVLFWGALNRSENSSAIIWFLENCWGKVISEYSDAKLYIVGMNPGRDIRAYSSSNIIVTGYVDDPSPYFERVHVGIAPLFQGAGVKVKVLEMLKAGIPVVSTEIGAEGIESNVNLKMADKSNFSRVLIDFLSMPITQ